MEVTVVTGFLLGLGGVIGVTAGTLVLGVVTSVIKTIRDKVGG